MKKYDVNRLKRQVLGLSQKEVADKAGCSSCTISQYESGDGGISPMALRCIEWAYEELWHDVKKYDENKNQIALEGLVLLECTKPVETFMCLQHLMYRISKTMLDYREQFMDGGDDRI